MPSRNAGAQRGRQSTAEPRAGAERSPAAREEAPKLLQVGSALGNHATAALLAGGLLHRKVAIGPADDPLEREADRLADRALGGTNETPAVSTARPAVQRECASCAAGGKPCSHCAEEDEEAMRREPAAGASGNGGGMAAQVDASLAALGPGRAMSPDLRGYFEPRFGHDFGDVRLHTGTTADTAARAARARAFTLRDDVVFAAGEYRPATRGGRRLLAHELAHVVQQAPPAARRKPVVRRQAMGEDAAASEPPAMPEQATAPTTAPPQPQEPETESAASAPEMGAERTPERAGAKGLIVADDAETTTPEQMTKSAFLDELHTAACAAADQGLAGTGRDSEGCPWIERYFERYREMSAERLESDLLRYVPGTAGATSARDYIAPTAEHIRASVAHWAETGEMPDLPGMGLLGMLGGALGGLGRMLFMPRPGGARSSAQPAAVAARLGPGSALSGSVRSRMESALGPGLGGARIHTDATAASLATRFNARAFTVGSHVAFGASEYRPGTLAGDALLAHELAHVTHQENETTTAAGTEPVADLESDADLAAAHVAADQLLPGRRRGRWRRLRGTGLRLQRCRPEGKPGVEEKVKGRPGMGLDTGPPPIVTKEYSLDEYIELWEKAAGREMTQKEVQRLAAGCVGISRLNVGGNLSLAECYDKFPQAQRRASELEAQLGTKPFIFSKRFWSMGRPYTPDPTTGKVDMSGYTGTHPPGTVNFDYGWYDEANKTWWHANHCDPVLFGGECARNYADTQRMKVYQSTLAHYSDRSYFGADKQVFCVVWSKLTQ